jgi:hypothetical protein
LGTNQNGIRNGQRLSPRELARQMNVPAGTILARANREGWTQQIQSAKALAKREDSEQELNELKNQLHISP